MLLAGLDDPYQHGRGVALADFNRDGRVDIVYGNWNGPHRLYLQAGAPGRVRFRVRAGAAEPSLLGTPQLHPAVALSPACQRPPARRARWQPLPVPCAGHCHPQVLHAVPRAHRHRRRLRQRPGAGGFLQQHRLPWLLRQPPLPVGPGERAARAVPLPAAGTQGTPAQAVLVEGAMPEPFPVSLPAAAAVPAAAPGVPVPLISSRLEACSWLPLIVGIDSSPLPGGSPSPHCCLPAHSGQVGGVVGSWEPLEGFSSPQGLWQWWGM